MPPHLPRKRLRTPSPENKASSKSKSNGRTSSTAPARKPTLFDDLDHGDKSRSAERTKSALQQMHDDDSSSLSSLSDSDLEFEDVPATKRQKVAAEAEDGDEDEDVEFEDVPNHEAQRDPVITGDLELTLYQNNDPTPARDMGQKGPSKRQKLIRNVTHCIHVQYLLWHNAYRNSWLCDQEVQAIMMSHLSPRLWEEVDRWKQNNGLEVVEEAPVKGKKGAKAKATSKAKGKQSKYNAGRDWGNAADRLEKGALDLSHGDPLFRLMKSLSAWWKQRFTITAPGLRKYGYMDARRLGKWRSAFGSEEHDPEKFGEKISGIEDFRTHAQRCEGSRDVGAQLFVALLRAIGLEARMITNLQTLGYGWSKSEDADDDKADKITHGDGAEPSKKANGKSTKKSKKKAVARPSSRRTHKSDQDALKMDLDESDEYAEPLSEESDVDSVIDVTETHLKSKPPIKIYDKDLDFPHYWTEVLSPVTGKWLSVDPIVKSVVGTNRELVESLEPRGGKADKAKQIVAYVVGHSQDGTAKDVTVRYLRKQIFPGKTKGVRMGIEKVPIYNKHGKVKRYEQSDWFKRAMSGYVRGDAKRPITGVDEIEDSTDLRPAVPEKKEVKEGEETLQFYKASKEFVLERHLKREEALLPNAKPVKTFRNKVKGGKVEEEDVYSRKDVVAVKSAETWHKQGRGPKPGAQPRKHAPYRAATTNRRREIAEAEARTGEKVLQPLYSEDQTEFIIPPPIENGVIPKNEYGNIDMFAEHMCPEGAVHLPYRGSVRVCKRLQIDYAEAVVGFEFGHRMAVPVIQGVVVAEEHQDRVLEEIEKDEVERARKEDEKRRKLALGLWRKFLMGLRIADRIKQDYGYLDDIQVLNHADGDEGAGGFERMQEHDEDMAGGFLPDGYDEEDPDDKTGHTSGYFPGAFDDDEDGGADPFEIDHGVTEEAATTVSEPVSTHANDEQQEVKEQTPAPQAKRKVAKPKPKAKPKPRNSTRRRTRRKLADSSEEDDDDGDENFALTDSE